MVMILINRIQNKTQTQNNLASTRIVHPKVLDNQEDNDKQMLNTSRSKRRLRSHSSISSCPPLLICGLITQKGSGTKVVIRRWCSTQKPRVGVWPRVWQGPYLHRITKEPLVKFQQPIETCKKNIVGCEAK